MKRSTFTHSKAAINLLLMIILVIMIAGIPLSVHAQNEIKLSRLQIDLWPEYDRPDVLVIYRIELSSENPLPAKMALRIPLESREPINLAEKDIDGVLYNLDYTTRIEGEWVWVSFTTPSQVIQLEYYDPSIVNSNGTRTFEYRWPGDYQVEETVIQIQQPVNTTRMEIRPNLGEGVAGTDGLIYYLSSIGSLEGNTPFSINFEYDKPDDTLSSSQVMVYPSDPIAQQTTGRSTFGEFIPWVVGTLGVVMIVAGGFWYWHTGRDIQNSRRKRHQASSAEEADELAVYCHKCGKRASEGDLFCRVCGARLRVG